MALKRGAIDARCCEELECINVDLERRLENQAADYMRLEENIAQERRRWEQKVADAEKNCNDWRDMYNREKKLKQNVDDRLRRAEMDLYHILQKKYDIVKEAKAEVKKEMLDSEKIKKDLGIRDHIMSRARRITGTTSTKARHIGTPRAGIPQVCMSMIRIKCRFAPPVSKRLKYISSINTYVCVLAMQESSPEETRAVQAISVLVDFFAL